MVATKGAGFNEAPPIAPVKGTVGTLLSVARTIPGNVNWRSGVSWRQGLPCGTDDVGPGFTQEYCDQTVLEDGPDTNKPEQYPFRIYVPYFCDWVVDEAEMRQSAEDALDAVTGFNLARELWTGSTEALNNSLQNTADDVSAGSPVHPVTALASLLEAWEACTQQSGDGTYGPIVHAPAFAVTSLIANFAVNQQGDVYYGPQGSLISSGPGYPTGHGAAPTAVADDAEEGWIYISGPVQYALSAIDVFPDEQAAHIERRTNQYRVWAQRDAIVRFDPCCVFAISVYQPSPVDSSGV